MTKSRGIYEMHGKRHTRLYNVWCKMCSRCNNPSDKAYPNYGGRGIFVCERWSKFSNFYADMGDPPLGLCIERVDNNRGYSPDNCVWADRQTQTRNKRDNHLLTINGKTMPLAAWAELSGLKYATVHQRILKGWTPHDAVFTPLVTLRKGVPRGTKLHKFRPTYEQTDAA